MSNPLELPFGSPPGKVQDLSQSSELATNNHQHMPKLLHCSKPSRWWQPPRVTKNRSHNDPQVPLDAIAQANTLGITPNLTMMMNQ
jgi:hypothetical protein